MNTLSDTEVAIAPRSLLAPLVQIVTMGATYAASNLTRGGIAFATSLVIARGLGREAFGGWVFCSTWASFLTTVVDLGFGTLLTRDAAKQDRICPLLGNAIAVRLSLSLPMIVVFFLAAPRLVVQFAPVVALRASIPLAVFGTVYGCFAAVFRARSDRLIRILSLESFGAAAQGTISWVLLRLGGGIVELLWLATCVQAVQLVVAALWLTRARVHSDRFVRLSWRGVFDAGRRAAPFAGVGFISTAQLRLIPLALGYISGAEKVALFAASWKMGNVARAVSSASLTAGLPVLANHENQPNAGRVRSLFHRALTLFAWISAAVLAVGARPLLRLAYGSAFAGGVNVLIWVAIGLVPSFVNAGRRIYLYAAGRESVVFGWTAATLLVQAAACAVLIPGWGAPGAACALAIGDLAAVWPLSLAVKASSQRDRLRPAVNDSYNAVN